MKKTQEEVTEMLSQPRKHLEEELDIKLRNGQQIRAVEAALRWAGYEVREGNRWIERTEAANTKKY